MRAWGQKSQQQLYGFPGTQFHPEQEDNDDAAA